MEKYTVGSFQAEDRVAKLRLIHRVHVKGRDSKGRASWECQCDCGTMVVRREDFLQSGRANSCGCENKGQFKRGADCGHWTGCGDLNGQYFCSVRHGAKTRNLEFSITIEYAWSLFVQQEGKCILTGLPLNFCGFRDRQRGHQQTASLDRIEQDKGYVEGNVQWVHKDVNMMKKEYEQERFIEICRLVTASAA